MESQSQPTSTSISKIISVASIAAGIQFGWALQLSLLTPYVQLLGVPHAWAAFIWLCGPVSGMLVQPIVGYQSDRTTSRFGRRRPFIFTGAIFVAIAVILIGFAADLGYMSGDSLAKPTKPRAVAIFVVGFWILDVANNMLQGPCRALLADLSNEDEKMMRTANALYSFFMGVGNVLGYAAGSYKQLHKIFPFSKTAACDIYCANLKSCFIISVTFLIILVFSSLLYVKENQHQKKQRDPETESGGIREIVGAFKSIKKPMWVLLLVTCLNWVAWFPFLLFDTDWMGREIYGGVSTGDNSDLIRLYDRGVRAGALGLLLNSVVLGVVSLGVDTCANWVGGTKRLWGLVNFILAVCLAMTVAITKVAESERRRLGGHAVPHGGVRAAALTVFGLLGIPLAITFSVPFALASIFSSSTGSGQGLSLGVLNLSIVLPQMFVSVTSGPFDEFLGGGNLPAFVAGAIAAVASGILAMTWLPNPPSDAKASNIIVGSH